MCPTFVNFTGDKNYGNTENNIKQFAKVIYPDGDRTVKVNSLARLDLEGRIHEINDNVESAWRLWRNCHQSDNNHIGTYKYHSKMDSIMMQMRRIIDDIFVSYFYKQFKKETLDLGYYKVDSFQWLFSDKPFKHWPKHISTTSDDKSNLLIKRKILKRLFIEENTCFLKLIAIANNGSKHSYFNTTPRSKTGDSFPTLLINVENKEKPGQLKEINVNLSQLILGFTDLLNSIGNRAYILNSTGNIPNTCPSCCKFHRIKHYELDLPRPA